MNIDFNKNISQPSINAAPAALPDAAAAKKTASAPSSPGLTVTESRASAEDLAVSSLPEDALSRTDSLGLLVSDAFTLPAPPMPDFSRA